jgi:UDP-N-acetylglucosamine--N-acetylmuramyl-(pentapeptide) pyrophosphoryl-undecaprenol N-acetylglucosamine transferase
VFGGSQGSAALNRAMVEAAADLSGSGLEVLHQTGERWLDSVRQAYGTLPAGWRLEPFLPRLDEEMSRCDLTVCRAGSMTLAELAAAGRPAILVPLPTSTHGHQLENARAFERAGAALLIEEKDLAGPTLSESVRGLVERPDRLAGMARRARALAQPEAAGRLAGLLFEIERPAA